MGIDDDDELLQFEVLCFVIINPNSKFKPLTLLM